MKPDRITSIIQRQLCVLLLALFSGAQLVCAGVKLPRVFTDHMRLRRDVAVPVWGCTEAGEKATVAFAGQTKTVAANEQGKWLAKLNPMPANAESREFFAQEFRRDQKVPVAVLQAPRGGTDIETRINLNGRKRNPPLLKTADRWDKAVADYQKLTANPGFVTGYEKWLGGMAWFHRA